MQFSAETDEAKLQAARLGEAVKDAEREIERLAAQLQASAGEVSSMQQERASAVASLSSEVSALRASLADAEAQVAAMRSSAKITRQSGDEAKLQAARLGEAVKDGEREIERLAAQLHNYAVTTLQASAGEVSSMRQERASAVESLSALRAILECRPMLTGAPLRVQLVGADLYSGEFALGQPNGLGVLVYANGDQLIGTFQAGACYGPGVFIYADGEKYSGSYKAGEPHGLGVYEYANGDVYSGSFRCGEKDGFGVYKLSSGAMMFDRFQADSEQSSVRFDPSSTQHTSVLDVAQAVKVCTVYRGRLSSSVAANCAPSRP